MPTSPATAPRPLALLANPSAGGGRAGRVLRALQQALATRDAPFRAVGTRDAAHVRRAAAGAAERGEVVVAIGGDGMLGLVADALADRPEATIGVVPGGRGNDFARSLGLPADPAAAAAALLDGEPVAIDAGAATDAAGRTRTFLSIASCGFDSEANRIANGLPAQLGSSAYVGGLVGALARLRPARYRVTLDGETLVHDGLTVAVANAGTYGGGMRLAPGASVVDGRFDVVLLGHPGRDPRRCDGRDRLRLLQVLPRVFRGTHVELPHVRVLRAATVRVEADRDYEVYGDGDPIGALPLSFAVRPRALRVIVPPGHRSPALAGGRA
ncbi:diacylglycerol/lipid kinase family protein [Patulibacter defluvii]|uniref:diacylglycerol/lipid kinase family protein n=1 Tax=Patulibacter defluvii TaxID=3095358 RepID=UPI002A74794C|nr:YegS/Rv2252/BmrU family lipid kinase [Patulibacter sp. DM4]